MIRNLCVLLFCCLLLSVPVVSAQAPDTVMVTFHVSKGLSTYEVFPKDSILWGGQENTIRVRAKGKKRNAYVILEGGRLKPVSKNDSMFVATVNDTVVVALLSIREKNADGTTRLAYTKPYRIKRIPPPVLYVCGVKTDSVIDKQQLIEEDLLYARSVQFKFRLVIESFDMTFITEKGDKALHSSNNHFTIEQRREIHKLLPGNTISFDNIKCRMPSGEVQTLKPVQIYIDDTNKYRVGLRKVDK
ncbi:MAG: hypothetical protein ACHQRM_07175 [Bacteroidia bacterium]